MKVRIQTMRDNKTKMIKNSGIKVIKISAVLSMTLLFMIQNAKAVDLYGNLFTHDPSTIIKEGDTYWQFYTAPGIGVKKSNDLITWTSGSNRVFNPINWQQNYPEWTIEYFGTTNTDGNIWAPDIIYMNGAYYLYYSCSSFGSSNSAIGVVKSSSLNSPDWTDMGAAISSNSGYNAIDPALFRDDDGKVYMVFGSFFGGIGIVDIDTVTGQATSSITHLYGGSSNNDTEASYIFKEGSYYYLVVNRGACCRGLSSTYYILVGRSTSLKGPYSDFRTLLPNKDGRYIGPGHFALLRDSCANYVSTHYYDGNAHGNATLDILKMKMVEDWPVLYRDFSFDNCNDEIRLDAGSNGSSCLNTDIELASLDVAPSAMFYSSLFWDDGDAGGTFNDDSILHPVYTPPTDFLGQLTLTLSGIGIDTTTSAIDSTTIEFIENTITVDAGSDETAYEEVPFDLSSASTVASATNATSYLWDDNGAGGMFLNKGSLLAIYTPPAASAGTITLTLTAYDYANCSQNDDMTLTVLEPLNSIRYVVDNQIKMYPNPNDNDLITFDIFDYQKYNGKIMLEIYSIEGKMIFNQSLSPSPSIDVKSGLNMGVYKVFLKKGLEIIFQNKLVIN